MAQTVYGAASGPNISGSVNQSESRSSSHTVNNSQLNAQNIHLNSSGDTTLDGANIAATDKLKLDVGGNLIIASQQNSYSSNSHNAGVSGGISLGAGSDTANNSKSFGGAVQNIGSSNGEVGGVNAGLNAGSSRSLTTQTQQTTLTGNSVDINVEGKTTIRGAAVAAVDEDGKDNGQLNIDTQSLEIVHLTNSSYSNDKSQGISTGVGIGNSANSDDPNVNLNTSSLSYSNNSHIEVSKTLATVGQGNITVRDDEETGEDSTKEINRDIDNANLDLYDVDRQQGNVDLTVDTRLLSEEGRDQIAEDLLKTGMIADAVGQAITTEKVGVEDIIDEVQKSNTIYETVKAEVANDPELAKALQNPDLTPEQKEQMLDQITGAVMVKLGYAEHSNHIMATAEPGANGEEVAGFYSEETGDAYINDQNAGNTKGLVTTAGHEAAHAMDDQDKIATEESYAENFGENLASYTDMALDISGYDDGMAATNSHNGNSTSVTVQQNNADFAELDKTKGDAYCSGGYGCYGAQTEQVLIDARINPQPVETLDHYQIRERVNENGIVVGYEAYNPEAGNSIIMLPQELSSFKQVVGAIPTVGYSLEGMTEAQHTGTNAAAGLHDDGYLGGAADAAGDYITDPNTLFEILGEVAGVGASGKVFRFDGTKINPGKAVPKNVPDVPSSSVSTGRTNQQVADDLVDGGGNAANSGTVPGKTNAGNSSSNSVNTADEVDVDVTDDVGSVQGVPKGGDKPKVTAETEIDGQKITGTNQQARDPDLADPSKPTLIEGKVQAKVDKDGKERPNSNMADAHAEVEVIQNAYDQGLTQGRDMHITVEGEPICTYCRSDIRDMADEAGLNSVSVTHTNQFGVKETVTWSRNEDGTMGRKPMVTPGE